MGRRLAKADTNQDMDDIREGNDDSYHSTGEDHHMTPSPPAELDDSLDESFHTAEEDSDAGKEYSDPPLLPLELLRASEAKTNQMTPDSSSEALPVVPSEPTRSHRPKTQRRAPADLATKSHSKSALRKERTRRNGKAVLTGRILKSRHADHTDSDSTTSGRDAILQRRLLAASHTNPDVRPPNQRRQKSRR